MITSRQNIFDQISQERDRQFNLPGSEYDQQHTLNDWIAISSHYLSRSAERHHFRNHWANQREDLIKAAAIIVAAIEHLDRNA